MSLVWVSEFGSCCVVIPESDPGLRRLVKPRSTGIYGADKPWTRIIIWEKKSG